MDGDPVRSRDPIPAGYRLPTEAEWAFSARAAPSQELLKYPWGKTFPPVPRSGNYADASATSLLARTLQGYSDGYTVSTKPASFDPTPQGLYDLGGNVAEWCHDFYDVYDHDPERTLTDPVGPQEGTYHVIRGSSWKDSSISELRLSYRDYGQAGRDDVGFRIARYLDGGGGL